MGGGGRGNIGGSDQLASETEVGLERAWSNLTVKFDQLFPVEVSNYYSVSAKIINKLPSKMIFC